MDAVRSAEDAWRRVRHPGVAPAGTEAPPGPTLAQLALELEDIAGVFAVLATTVADLHDIGIAAGGIRADQVVVGPDGRPVIVDLSRAVPIGRRESGGAALAEVGALGALLGSTVARCPSRTGSPPPLRRRSPRLPTHPFRRQPRPIGDRVAEAIAGAARKNLSLRQFASVLAHPDARLPRQLTSRDAGPSPLDLRGGAPPAPTPVAIDTTGRPPARSVIGQPLLARWSRPRTALGAIALAGLLLTAVTLLAERPASAPGRGGPGADGRRPSPPVRVCVAFDASSSCRSFAIYLDGILHTDSGRYAIGRPGDVIAAGRWACGATPTVALLRPGKGDVWAFPDWPATASAPVAGRLVGHVAGGRSLSTRAGASCDSLVVDRAGASPVVLDRRRFS